MDAAACDDRGVVVAPPCSPRNSDDQDLSAKDACQSQRPLATKAPSYDATSLPQMPLWRVWGRRALLLTMLLAALYCFILCLGLMASSFKVLTGRSAGDLFTTISNPLAGVTVGVLATSALQSSSTTTSIAVALVGADALSVATAIYVIMGSNVGTSVTNTIVAVGQVHRRANFVRAMTAATVHDCFNLLTVIVLLPIEAATGFLEFTTRKLLEPLGDSSTQTFKSPLKVLVDPVVKAIIEPNKDRLKQVAKGQVVEGSIIKGGFLHDDWDMSDGAAGALGLSIALIGLVLALACMVRVLGKVFSAGNPAAASDSGGVTPAADRPASAAVRWLKWATTTNGYFSMLIGMLVTIAVQSSSVTTSALTPLCGTGMISLEQMLPLTLGANVGTTTTAVLAALATPKVGAVQIALAHLAFNLLGILLFYPVPKMRQVPLGMARWLGAVVDLWRPAAFVYIGSVFFVLPLLLLGIAELMGRGVGQSLLATLLLLVLLGYVGGIGWWWKTRGKPAAARRAALLVRQSTDAPAAGEGSTGDAVAVDVEMVGITQAGTAGGGLASHEAAGGIDDSTSTEGSAHHAREESAVVAAREDGESGGQQQVTTPTCTIGVDGVCRADSSVSSSHTSAASPAAPADDDGVAIMACRSLSSGDRPQGSGDDVDHGEGAMAVSPPPADDVGEASQRADADAVDVAGTIDSGDHEGVSGVDSGAATATSAPDTQPQAGNVIS